MLSVTELSNYNIMEVHLVEKLIEPNSAAFLSVSSGVSALVSAKVVEVEFWHSMTGSRLEVLKKKLWKVSMQSILTSKSYLF